MRSVSEATLLATWEARGRPPAARALDLAGAAAPEEDVAAWTLGRRDALLLDFHAAMFGDRFAALVTCPACDEPLELEFAEADVRAPSGDASAEHELLVEETGHRLVFRLPCCKDVLSAAAHRDAVSARLELVERCVVRAERDGRRVPARALPALAVAALAEAMAERDPQAEVRLALECPACEYSWSAFFDVADYLLRKVDERAQLLVGEIAELAAAFGWTEAEILRVRPARRRLYLDLVRA